MDVTTRAFRRMTRVVLVASLLAVLAAAAGCAPPEETPVGAHPLPPAVPIDA